MDNNGVYTAVYLQMIYNSSFSVARGKEYQPFIPKCVISIIWNLCLNFVVVSESYTLPMAKVFQLIR